MTWRQKIAPIHDVILIKTYFCWLNDANTRPQTRLASDHLEQWQWEQAKAPEWQHDEWQATGDEKATGLTFITPGCTGFATIHDYDYGCESPSASLSRASLFNNLNECNLLEWPWSAAMKTRIIALVTSKARLAIVWVCVLVFAFLMTIARLPTSPKAITVSLGIWLLATQSAVWRSFVASSSMSSLLYARP